jgi:hypothetical protein
MLFLAHNSRRITNGARQKFRMKMFDEIVFLEIGSFFLPIQNSREKYARNQVDEIDSWSSTRSEQATAAGSNHSTHV